MLPTDMPTRGPVIVNIDTIIMLCKLTVMAVEKSVNKRKVDTKQPQKGQKDIVE